MSDEDKKNDLSHLNIKKIPEKQKAIAIADRLKDGKLPEIIASGRGNIAEQILQFAFENDIKVREDSVLADMLISLELDSPIPSEAFGAIAEIMSYIYRANGEKEPFASVLSRMQDVDEDDALE